MKKALVATAAGTILVCVVGIALAIASGPDMTLAEGLRQTIKLVNETAAEIAPDDRARPHPANPDLAHARELRNNHSFADHSSPRHPGYNDCDAWNNLLHDGWSASYALEIPLRDDEEAERMLEQVRADWERRGYEISATVYPGRSGEPQLTRLTASTSHANYQFNVQWNRNLVSIQGATHCLPPGPLGILWW